MAGPTSARCCAIAAFLLFCHSASAAHPCSTEVASACADRPGSDIGACLKDPEEHDYPTEISSGCTDFIALNAACDVDIEEFCDGNQFNDDTLLCLTKWTPLDNLSEKCQKVLSWAAPQAEAEAEKETVTDELGMSEEDYKEKKEWQKKRAAARGEAIERMKMKEVDRKKEEDRVALEEFKKTDPEGYATMIQQQEEEARQQAEFKKKERARAAAMERAKRKAAGLDDEENAARKGDQQQTRTSNKPKSSWAYTIFSFVVIGVVGGLIYLFVQNPSGSARDNNKKQKKKRG